MHPSRRLVVVVRGRKRMTPDILSSGIFRCREVEIFRIACPLRCGASDDATRSHRGLSVEVHLESTIFEGPGPEAVDEEGGEAERIWRPIGRASQERRSAQGGRCCGNCSDAGSTRSSPKAAWQ